jgi:biopolymer transport protein ExbB/TolQ
MSLWLILGLTVPWGLALWGWIKLGLAKLEARGLRFEHAAERAARVQLEKTQEDRKQAVAAGERVLVEEIARLNQLLRENESPESLQKRLDSLRGPRS